MRRKAKRRKSNRNLRSKHGQSHRYVLIFLRKTVFKEKKTLIRRV